MISLSRRMKLPARCCATLFSVVLLLGCGESGPAKYELTGSVTFGGKPIGYGDIRFEPKEGEKNVDTIAFTRIKNGAYTTEVVGGPHWIFVRNLTGDVDMGDPENPGGKAMFVTQYRGEVDLPPLEQGSESAPVKKDIDVPSTHK